MLCRLSISDIAVIDHAEITLSGGFTALTGETGAGKSLIIDAILMVLGGRTGREIIRAGARSAVAEAAFFCTHPLSEDGMLILRRELFSDGRNLCSINGKMVTVSALREVGDTLLSIHGQHDTEKLLHRAGHLTYVDGYAENTALLEAYTTLYTKQKEITTEMEALRADDSEKARRLEMLDFWVQEIEEAAPQIGEEEILEEKRTRLRHSEKIKTAVWRAMHALDGEDGAARDLLANVARTLENVGEYDTRLAEAAEEARDILYRAEELAQTLRDMSDMETDGAALSEIEARLDVLFRLKTKYGKSIEDVLLYAEKAAEERKSILYADARIKELEKELGGIEEKLGKAAEKLTKSRKKAAEAIADGVMEELRALDMAKVRFSVELSQKPYGEDGADAIEFFIATNPSEPLKPLSKIASGGELSRVCLALYTVLLTKGAAGDGTMIFDEIDTGISGRAAQRVGEKLAALALDRQILCVTHLPQIAARADAQFKIDKTDMGDRFTTTVSMLDRAGRVEEIARMIGGDRVSARTLETAEEMLS